MKKLQKSGSFLRGVLAAAVGLMACVATSQAHPYASALTNFVAGGTNFVSFYLNEGGGAVTVTTYPSTTVTSLGTLAAGKTTFALPGLDTSYAITVNKTGSGTVSQTSVDANFNIWNGGLTVRAIGVNQTPKYGDAFGRVYVGLASSTVTDSQVGYNVRQWGIYGLTPDMKENAIFGGNSSNAVAAVYESFSMTFTAIPANAATFTMDGITTTWTTAAITNTLTQVAVTNSAAAAATNLAAWMNLNSNSLPASVTAFASNNVLYFSAYAQNVSGATYFSFANLTGTGPFGNDFTTGNTGAGSGPYRIQVAKEDGAVYVTDATVGNANVYVFDRNMLSSTNKIWTLTGTVAGEAAFQHGYPADIAIRGTQADGNMTIWTADNDMPIPGYFNDTNQGTLGLNGLGNFGAPQESAAGDQNVIYRYDIGSSSFPVTNTPKVACTLGLNGGFPGQVCSVDLGPNTNYVYAAFRRANFSDGGLQVFRADTGARVYTSLGGTPTSQTDVFAVDSSGTEGTYGVRVSPDGRFIAALLIDGQVFVANLTNGIPDSSSIVVVSNLTVGATAREISWDSADNIYVVSATAQPFSRQFTLGLTTTCVTSNDITGTNGSFNLILPPASVSLVNAVNASQNYGTPAAGSINVNIGTNVLASPVSVTLRIGGSATNGVNYNIATGNFTVGSFTIGVVTNTNNTITVTFPAGTYPSAGNWNQNITITPTASPAVGPTLTVTLSTQPGTTYIVGNPAANTVNIFNTGGQFFFISGATSGTNMSRAITSDYAKFTITRWGDLSGPGAAGHSPANITLTNFALAGTATYSTDYLAGVQVFTGSVPSPGNTFTVSFGPGDVSKTCMVGLPVSHSAVLVPATNLTVLPGLTNVATGTNQTSLEGSSYTVSTATTPITLLDNAQGTLAEVVVWSDPLTNAAATGYSVTYAATNLGTVPQAAVVIPNYVYTPGGPANGSASTLPANSNNFDVQLGWPVSSENSWETMMGVGFFGPAYSPPVSDVMVANNWSNVLRLTVNKQSGPGPTVSGVNVFPTTQRFVGNYAMRFDMYLSVWSGALNNNNPLNFPKQFAAFGIGTQGTNCDWRLSSSNFPAGTFSGPTNADGIWYSVDAGDQSLTPADFDAFASPALPNSGTSDFLSATAVTQAGTFKRPPFAVTDGPSSGTPINKWVSVSVESRAQTNVDMLIDNTVIFRGLAYTNNATTAPSISNPLAGLWTNGLPMLGYLQPYTAQSDESAFVYFSNLRMVELSPYIIAHPQPQLVLAGSNVTFTATATYASLGITNKWFGGTTAPATAFITNSSATTNFTDSFTINNVQAANAATNFWAIFNDQAGSVTSFVATLEVITGPANAVAGPGSNATFTVSAAGRGLAPTFQWQTNGINLTNNTKYANVTTASLTVSNVGVPDTTVTYDCLVSEKLTNLVNNLYVLTNLTAGISNLATFGASLSIVIPPSGVTVSPTPQTNVWGSSATFTANVALGDGPFLYAWKRNGTNLVGATKYSGTNTASLVISNLTQADGTNTYQVNVGNGAGTATNNPAGVLVVQVPPPTLSSSVAVGGGSVAMSFTSTNVFDKTNAFILLSAPIVTGPYTNAPGTVYGSNINGFTVTVPQTTNANMFYRLQHVN